MYLFDMPADKNIVRGRGSQINTQNPFQKDEYGRFEEEGLDVPEAEKFQTEIFIENPRKIVNKVSSPDLGFIYSMNPYQGCEHGCVYCYARNSHHYWGFSAGLDFERKIIVKKNAAEVLARQLKNPRWKVSPIMLSGNTDCYQPQERKLEITREMLKVLLKHKHPVGIITKNELISRDMDLLKELSDLRLVNVAISINSLDEEVRRKLEPRTSSYRARIKTIERLAAAGIPVNVMVAPVIPGLTSSEIPHILEQASEAGARSAAYIMVRLNGSIGEVFTDWVKKQFPDRSEKILNQIAEVHGGNLNDSRYGTRMKGEGQVAESIRQLFKVSKKKYFGDVKPLRLDTRIFDPNISDQLRLF